MTESFVINRRDPCLKRRLASVARQGPTDGGSVEGAYLRCLRRFLLLRPAIKNYR